MESLDINFENCYGIKKLNYSFDFGKKNTYLVYASNGVMKTSFAKVFKQLAIDKNPKDEAFPKRKTVCNVLKDNHDQINKEEIFVINSFEDQYISANSAKLMSSEDLKKQYDSEMIKVNMFKEGFISEIRKTTNSNMDVIGEFSKTFGTKPIDFLDILLEQYNANILSKDSCGLNFNKVPYLDIFNDGIESYVSKPANLKSIQEYNEQYNKILDKYTMFDRGVFSPYNIENIAESLDNNGFFKTHKNHLVLNGDRSVQTTEQLTDLVNEVKTAVMNDKSVRAKFDKISTDLEKRTMKSFRSVIENSPNIISMLEDYKGFRVKSWIEILKKVSTQYKLLMESYSETKKVIAAIKEEAKNTITDWQKSKEIFERRFRIPVEITVPNMDDVLLNEVNPEFILSFYDKDADEKTPPMERKNLESILSQGEKRALYLLNIIYDLETLRISNQEVIIVADDISESFDYKNKYAIIEYLQEYIKESNFKLIILTHNFDFFRTLGRRSIKDLIPIMATRSHDGIEFKGVKYIVKNPFTLIKTDIQKKNPSAIITAIPFVRNIIEYTIDEEEESDNYNKLTALLHVKENSKDIVMSEVAKIFADSASIKSAWVDAFKDKKVFDFIFETADQITSNPSESMEINDKVVLSIAIRLKAEQFIIDEIEGHDNNLDRVNEERDKNKSQFGKLLQLYKNTFPKETKKTLLLDEVNLMTSENIHINSFMFEPIIDMSILSLAQLYADFQLLCNREDICEEVILTKH